MSWFGRTLIFQGNGLALFPFRRKLESKTFTGKKKIHGINAIMETHADIVGHIRIVRIKCVDRVSGRTRFSALSIVFVFLEVAPRFKVVVGVAEKTEGGIYRSARQPVARANSVEVRTWPANRYK